MAQQGVGGSTKVVLNWPSHLVIDHIGDAFRSRIVPIGGTQFLNSRIFETPMGVKTKSLQGSRFGHSYRLLEE